MATRYALLALVRRSAVLIVALLAATAAADPLRRANLTAAGEQAGGTAAGLSLSHDGRFAAFTSSGRLIPPGNANTWTDVFVKDLASGRIVRASTSAEGIESDATSNSVSISANGRFVAFQSIAANLVPGDSNGHGDVFVKDLQSGRIVLASIRADGVQGDGVSFFPALSADGRHVAFLSFAGNFAAGDANGTGDMFVKDLQSGTLSLLSARADGGGPGTATGRPAISADGRYVAFASFGAALVDGDTNGFEDVFVADTRTGRLRRALLSGAGAQGDRDSGAPAISASGRHVAFQSGARNLADGPRNRHVGVFVKDLRSGDIVLATRSHDGTASDGGAFAPAISADGRVVAFASAATNLVAADPNDRLDVFVVDLRSGTTKQLSTSAAGAGGNRDSRQAAISGDGRIAGFESAATNLVDDDSNGTLDVFVGRR